ncbi:hypothetical protein [Levilactobacillus bambusae]|uniref:Uncharacterized protein n=1 Tax=Levilactobacillus bambusae TaxID=2024736 RepID=A0A2V1N1X5_9LACO|nr:hypothetical protein [Levilactobacillus bambusae]PWG00983.1 hypothetical protein DCM90_02075 [Levilactobacillus bambusae]
MLISKRELAEKSVVKSVEVIKVIEVQSLIGEGTEESVVRHLKEYFDLEGNLLAKHDTLND